MIIATLPNRGERVAVMFKHPRTDIGSKKEPVIQRSTTCTIAYLGEDGRPGQPVATATVVCSPQDNFCKETGRKLALTRALRRSFFMRADRVAIWAAYFRRGRPEPVARLDVPRHIDHEVARMEDEGGPPSGPEQRTGEEVV